MTVLAFTPQSLIWEVAICHSLASVAQVLTCSTTFLYTTRKNTTMGGTCMYTGESNDVTVRFNSMISHSHVHLLLQIG